MSQQISIVIHGENPDIISHKERKSGLVRIQPEEDLEAGKLTICLKYEATGKMSPETTVVDQQTLFDTERLLRAGETYEYEFDVEQSSSASSYKGKNVTVLFSLDAEVILGGEEANKGLVNKLSRLISGDKTLSESRYITAQSNVDFRVSDDYDHTMSLNNLNLLTLMIIILFGVLIAISIVYNIGPGQQKTVFGWIAGGLIISALAGFGLQKLLIRNMIGGFKMFLQHKNKEAFSCTIESQKGWQSIRKATCYYQVSEKVVDTRGTSDMTYRHKIFKSPIELLDLDHFGEASFTFQYPDSNIPLLRIEDVNIEWEIILEMVTVILGMRLNFKGKFRVTDV